MTLAEAFKAGGVSGAAIELGQRLGVGVGIAGKVSALPLTQQNELIKSLSSQNGSAGLGFTDKALIAGGVVIVSMFALSRVLK